MKIKKVSMFYTVILDRGYFIMKILTSYAYLCPKSAYSIQLLGSRKLMFSKRGRLLVGRCSIGQLYLPGARDRDILLCEMWNQLNKSEFVKLTRVCMCKIFPFSIRNRNCRHLHYTFISDTNYNIFNWKHAHQNG